MKTPPRLRLEPRRSRIGCIFLALACAMTSILLGVLPLFAAVVSAGAIFILTVLAHVLSRSAGRGVPSLIQLGVDRRITVTDRSGHSSAGTIRDDSYVGAWLTTIVWCADGERWWHPAHTILVLPDTLSREEFRRLRVVLRYGRPIGAEKTNAVDAG